MKHVPNGREERKNCQGRVPSTHEEKQPGTGSRTREENSSANGRQVGKVCVPIGCGLVVRALEKDAAENPMRVVKVGESSCSTSVKV